MRNKGVVGKAAGAFSTFANWLYVGSSDAHESVDSLGRIGAIGVNIAVILLLAVICFQLHVQ